MNRISLASLALLVSLLPALRCPAAEALHPLTPVPISQVSIEDDFWAPRRLVWRRVTLPDCLAKFEKDGALTNFDRVRDGTGGDHAGPPWYDGLIYEMIRAGADFLAAQRDPALEARLDGYISRIAAAAARDPQGYVNTYTQLREPNHRWGLHGGNDVRQHDVYNFGGLVDAGVHYYRATGKTTLLRVAVTMANHACDVIGPPPRANVVPGHALAEEALANLYLLCRARPELKKTLGIPVHEDRYLKLAEFWIENRGHHQGRSDYGAYDQDGEPVFQQKVLAGHAVRATLMAAGLTALAAINDRDDYRQAARRLWSNMMDRRMHLTGGVGASRAGEAFGGDYDLPNNGYLETCAAVGSGFFSHNMNLAFGEARCADELERVLYNGVLAGVSLRGDSYFYENPLEAGPKHRRWTWHPCPCCPPMFLKIMAALPGYIYAQDADGLYVNLFVGSRAEVTLPAGKVVVRQTTRYPWQGQVHLVVEPEHPGEFNLSIRIPGWCQAAGSPDDLYQVVGRPASGAVVIKVNGQTVPRLDMVRGYARLRLFWKAGDTVELTLAMPVRRVHAHPRVQTDVGRVALMRGPVVYCLEGVDTPEGIDHLFVPPGAMFTAEYRHDLLGGIMVLRGTGTRLYRDQKSSVEQKATELLAIPYFANANRQPCPMRVWLPETLELAQP
ncbi:MAG: glycoside hydrolase family 127 protein [Planctomycetes bacterium]|nr:glycoside hydrolase family 127 protein [Planctomycetota bacterium]